MSLSSTKGLLEAIKQSPNFNFSRTSWIIVAFGRATMNSAATGRVNCTTVTLSPHTGASSKKP